MANGWQSGKQVTYWSPAERAGYSIDHEEVVFPGHKCTVQSPICWAAKGGSYPQVKETFGSQAQGGADSLSTIAIAYQCRGLYSSKKLQVVKTFRVVLVLIMGDQQCLLLNLNTRGLNNPARKNNGSIQSLVWMMGGQGSGKWNLTRFG